MPLPKKPSPFHLVLSVIQIFAGVSITNAQKPIETYHPKPNTNTIRRPPPPAPGELIVATNLTGATVELFTGPKGRERLRGSAVSDDRQQAVFTGLPAGRYRLSVKHDDYEPFVTDCVIRAGRGLPVVAKLVPRFGFLTISSDQLRSDTPVLIDGKPLAAEAIRRAEKTVSLKVPLGRRRVAIVQKGFRPLDREFEIVADAPIPLVLAESQRMLDVTAPAGARVYVNGVESGTLPAAGRLAIPLPRAENYKLSIEADGFESFTKSLISSDFDANESAALAPDLKRIIFSKAFSDSFAEGLAYWNAPSEWRAGQGRLAVRGAQPGFVRDRQYRNFNLELDLTLINGKGAAWLLRARNEKTFYLFQLSGPNAATPNTFRCFRIENGVPTLLKSDRIVQKLDTPKDQLHIVIEAREGRVTHSLSLLSAPAVQPIPVSVLEDASLGYGGIGLTAVDGEEFDVFQVVVLPVD